MVWYTFSTVPVVDPTTNDIVENATGGKFRLTPNGTDQPIRDLNGTTITSITSNQWGQSSQFQAESLAGGVQFGQVWVKVWADEVGAMALAGQQALTLATQAASDAAAAAAAAQASALAAQAAAAGNGGGGGGLSTSALDAYMNGGTTTRSAANLLNVIPGIRQRALVGSVRTGAWQARPNLPVVVAVGYAPGPTTAEGALDWDMDWTVPAP